MLRTIQRFHVNKLYPVRCYSTKSVVKPITKEEEHDNKIREFEKISNITQRIRRKKPQKPPFVKNLLLGIFDTDILAYPELEKEDLAALEANISKVRDVLERPEIKDAQTLTKPLLEKLGTSRLLGLQTSQLMGGRESNISESCRFLEEISIINTRNSIIINESLPIQILMKYANDQLKRKYLEPLINGEAVAAFCFIDPRPGNVDVLKRTALKSNEKTWILNGEKKFVVSGKSADFFIVIAHSDSTMKDQITERKLTAFVVERDFGGVTTSWRQTFEPNLEVADVFFDNTAVPAGNIIGNPEMGEHILKSITPEYRLSTGPLCSTIIRNVVDKLTIHFINKSQEPFILYETDGIRSAMAEMTTSLFAVESMIYLTSGLMDTYENQDCELESTIVKVFSSDQAVNTALLCYKLLGEETTLDSHWCNKFYKEAISQTVLNDNNDNLKMVIALLGLCHAGGNLDSLIKKLRNPLFHGPFILKRMWTHRRHANDNPKLDLNLHYYLHPTFNIAANLLEYSVLRLQYATELLFTRYGQDVVEKHIELHRLAESLIDIYAMTACVSRASRSYCIGLQHSEYEMVLASTFCMEAADRVKYKLQKIIDGHYQTSDENRRVISKRLFKFKKYYPVHPLSRNF